VYIRGVYTGLMNEDMYTGTNGCTTYVNGERGTTIRLLTIQGRIRGAFVRLDERPVMVYVELGEPVGSLHHKVVSFREIDREEFDRLNGIDIWRRDLGWDLAA
jgi:hypothetical protein